MLWKRIRALIFSALAAQAMIWGGLTIITYFGMGGEARWLVCFEIGTVMSLSIGMIVWFMMYQLIFKPGPTRPPLKNLYAEGLVSLHIRSFDPVEKSYVYTVAYARSGLPRVVIAKELVFSLTGAMERVITSFEDGSHKHLVRQSYFDPQSQLILKQLFDDDDEAGEAWKK